MSYIHDLYKGATPPERKAPFYFGDKPAYKSPMDRTVVDGRTAHREHMKKHNVVEAGDVKMGDNSTDRAPMGSVGADIRRAIQELNR